MASARAARSDEPLASTTHEAPETERATPKRILGSRIEADDAIQDTWPRLSRSDAAAVVDNLGVSLTTVVCRICLNTLRARRTRREESLNMHGPEPLPSDADADPAEETLFADSVGFALLVDQQDWRLMTKRDPTRCISSAALGPVTGDVSSRHPFD